MIKCEKLLSLHLRLSYTSSINPQDIKFKIVTLLQTHDGKCKRSRVVIWLTLTSVSKGLLSQTQTLEWQAVADQVLVIHLLSWNKHFGESGGKNMTLVRP